MKKSLAALALTAVLSCGAAPAFATGPAPEAPPAPVCTTSTVHVPAVTEEVQVPAVYAVEYEFRHKSSEAVKWQDSRLWNAEENPHSIGWFATGVTRDGALLSPARTETRVLTPARDETVETCVPPAVVPPVDEEHCPPVVVPPVVVPPVVTPPVPPVKEEPVQAIEPPEVANVIEYEPGHAPAPVAAPAPVPAALEAARPAPAPAAVPAAPQAPAGWSPVVVTSSEIRALPQEPAAVPEPQLAAHPADTSLDWALVLGGLALAGFAGLGLTRPKKA